MKMWKKKENENQCAKGKKFSEGARFLRATMFFRKCVISVATLLLIIHIVMYVLKLY